MEPASTDTGREILERTEASWLATGLRGVAVGCAAVLVLRIATDDRIGGLLPPNGTRVAVLVGIAAWGAAALLHPGLPRDARERLRLLSRVSLGAASLVVSLFAAEAATRVFFASRLSGNTIERLRAFEAGEPIPVRSRHPLAEIIELSPNPRLVYVPRANLDRIFGEKTLRTNAAGMREDRDYTVPAPPDTLRIIGIGDSGMWGWGLDQGQDYLSILETRLAARTDGTRYEVLNLAVPGYNTAQEVERLRSQGLRFGPHVVVVGWCENDFDPPFFDIPKNVFWRTDRSFLFTLAFHRPGLASLFQLPDTMADARDAARQSSPGLVPSGEEGVQSAFRELRDLGRRHGFAVLVFGPMTAEVARRIRATGLDVYDTRAEIPARTYPADWGVHFMHPRRRGHEALARHLEATLDERGWLSLPARAR